MKPSIKYCEGYKYQLQADYSVQTPLRPRSPIDAEYIQLNPDGLLTIRQGYACDGPSGPTWDSASSMRAAFVHDALYQMIREGFLPAECRNIADDLLCQICIEDGMWPWRARVWKWAVIKFAKSAASWDNERKVLTAP